MKTLKLKKGKKEKKRTIHRFAQWNHTGETVPGGGIYSIIEDSLCQVYLLETGLEAKHDGYVP